MARQQPQQLLAGVAGRAGDGDARAAAPDGGDGERDSDSTTVCIEKNIYTQPARLDQQKSMYSNKTARPKSSQSLLRAS